LAVDGGVPGVEGLSRFLRERAGTAAIQIIPKGDLVVLVSGITREKKRPKPFFITNPWQLYKCRLHQPAYATLHNPQPSPYKTAKQKSCF
jgi:hypothetical protein